MSGPADLPVARLGDRALFPDLAPVAYLNHAGISPPSLPVRRAVAQLLDGYAAAGGAAVTEALRLRSRLRDGLAALLGAAPADVAVTGGVSQGVQAIALSLAWRPGDRIVLLEGEFPANVTPWQRAAALFGLAVDFVPVARFEASDAEGLEALEAALRPGARLVALSAVQYRSGLSMPLAAIAEVCARRGAELFVDAAQALGAVPLDAGRLGLDYVVGAGHKWLMGLEGAGVLYVRPGRMEGLRPALASWLSHEDPVRFLTDGPGHLRYDRPLRRSPSVFEGGSSAVVAQAALAAAVELIGALGVEAIRRHGDVYLDRLEPALVERGFRSHRAPEPARRSGILSVTPPPGRDPRALREGLARRGVAVALPDGLVRFSPHWPNDADRELPRVLEAVDAALRG